MDNDDSRRRLAVGHRAEYLAITAGKIDEIPIGILTFRLHVTSSLPVNLMVTKAALERLREDIDFLLTRSTVLEDGESMEVTLAEVEAIHSRLG